MSRRSLVAVTAVVCLCQLSAAQAKPRNDRINALIQRGDQHYEACDSKRSTWRAVGYYREALKLDPRSFEALWRLGRAFLRLGELSNHKAGHRKMGKQGFIYASRAIGIDPRRVEGHFWAALCIGEHGKGLGVLSALREGIVTRFRKHLDAASRIDRSYDNGGPDRVYGLYHHSLPWPMKSNKKALRHLRRSLGYAPKYADTHFYLAGVLADDDKDALARRHLRICIQLANRRGKHKRARECKRRLRELR
jgi:tetratricopeptide (TPR) repeat protein